MTLRRSHGLALLFLILALLTAWAAADLCTRQKEARLSLAAKCEVVRRLQLTDLCLSTEATYTRHPTQSDLFAPFADHPGALEHFPSATLIGPPPQRRGDYASIP